MYIPTMCLSVNMADKNQRDLWRSELTAMSVTLEECCRVWVMYDIELHMVVVRALKRRQSRCQVSVVHPREGNTFVTEVEKEVRSMMLTPMSSGSSHGPRELLASR